LIILYMKCGQGTKSKYALKPVSSKEFFQVLGIKF
jgi:hypothetical protein